MILTNCAACAAPLAHNAPRCVRCKTRYCDATYLDASASLDELREAVTTLEETERIARRVLGGAHPTATGHVQCLGEARAALSARKMRICYPGYEEPSVAAAYLAS